MATHHILKDGTSYAISGGSDLANGTKYQIWGGRTLIDGTVYEIGFGPDGFTWVINETFIQADITENIDFTSNGKRFKTFAILAGSTAQIIYDDGPDGRWYAYYGKWTQQAFRTVTFAEMPTGALLMWLQDNAVQQ